LERRDKILWALFVNHRCNLRCDYCYLDYLNENRVIDSSSLYGILDFIYEKSHKIGGRTEVGFFGKEPLLNFEIIESAVSYVREIGYDFLFSINTNGLLLNRDRLDFLLDNRFRIVLSIDRFISKKDNLSIFGGYPKDEIRIRSTLNSKNIRHLGRILSDFYGAGFKGISLGFDYTDRDMGKIGEDEIVDIFVKCILWYSKKKSNDELLSIPMLDRIIAEGISPTRRRYEKTPFCEICNRIFSIDINGDIYPCWRFIGNEKLRMGSAFSGSLRKPDCTISVEKEIIDSIMPFDYICFWAYRKGGYILNNNLRVLKILRQVSDLIGTE